MKKDIFKVLICILCFTIIFSFCFVFADEAGEGGGTEEAVITEISKTVLGIVAWFGYAIALGALIFIAIKYMMSGANEKANLKNLAPKFLIGLAAIVGCFSIAKYFAELAGNDEAEEIIQVGDDAGNIFKGPESGLDINDDTEETTPEGT